MDGIIPDKVEGAEPDIIDDLLGPPQSSEQQEENKQENVQFDEGSSDLIALEPSQQVPNLLDENKDDSQVVGNPEQSQSNDLELLSECFAEQSLSPDRRKGDLINLMDEPSPNKAKDQEKMINTMEER